MISRKYRSGLKKFNRSSNKHNSISYTDNPTGTRARDLRLKGNIPTYKMIKIDLEDLNKHRYNNISEYNPVSLKKN